MLSAYFKTLLIVYITTTLQLYECPHMYAFSTYCVISYEMYHKSSKTEKIQQILIYSSLWSKYTAVLPPNKSQKL